MQLSELVEDLAHAIKSVDSRRPQAVGVRSGKAYLPGIGPLGEAHAIRLLAGELRERKPSVYSERTVIGVPYPGLRRQTCDLCIGELPNWEWAVEFKLLRMMGDNAKPNANMLMHILSPYAIDRSAVTDCTKLAKSSLVGRKAVLIYGFEAHQYPLEPAIRAFEVLAQSTVELSERVSAQFDGLVHPVHQRGAVFGWEVWRARE